MSAMRERDLTFECECAPNQSWQLFEYDLKFRGNINLFRVMFHLCVLSA